MGLISIYYKKELQIDLLLETANSLSLEEFKQTPEEKWVDTLQKELEQRWGLPVQPSDSMILMGSVSYTTEHSGAESYTQALMRQPTQKHGTRH